MFDDESPLDTLLGLTVVILFMVLTGPWVLTEVLNTFSVGGPVAEQPDAVAVSLGTGALLAAVLIVAVVVVVAVVVAVRQQLEMRADRRWRYAADTARLGDVAGRYADYHLDLDRRLSQPTLDDVTFPATARFIQAYAAAQDRAAITSATSTMGELTAYRTAVDEAERAWHAAEEAARRPAPTAVVSPAVQPAGKPFHVPLRVVAALVQRHVRVA